MSTLLDESIAALRTNHDQLAALVKDASAENLRAPSGATEWTVADVLSHLGSGSEIWSHMLQAAIGGTEAPEVDNQSIWDRWNAWTPEEQAAGFLEHHAAIVELLEGLDDEQRRTLTVDLGFMPAPVPLSTFVGMRLNEVANHAWDARAGLDPQAGIEPASADLVLRSLSGDLGFLLGFSTKHDKVDPSTVVAADGYGLTFDGGVSVTDWTPKDATATFTGPAEALVRLISGRLRPDVTPDGVEVTGSISLDDLRRVFPGY